MVNLEWYRTFKAVYNSGTLTKAAEELLISQPNVSVQLSSLEAYIGHPLFTRYPRKMEPTEFGKQLYTQIVEALDNLEKVETQFKKSALNKNPSIRLGTPPEIFQTYMAGNLRHLKHTVNIKFGMASELEQKLIDNELDFAIITKRSKPDESLICEPLLAESFMIVCSRQFDTRLFVNPMQGENLAETEKWLKQQAWYAYDSNLSGIRRFWKENFSRRPVLNVKAVIPDHNALLEAVANSNSITVSSDLIAGKMLTQGSLKILWKGVKETSNTLYFASRHKSALPEELASDMKNYIRLSFKL